MNQYLKNLNKIEFVVTYACTGCCKHCSEGDHIYRKEFIDPRMAAEAVKRIVSEYSIQTVMTFGGEPLLHPEAVYAIMQMAKALNVPHRQVITNGYFSQDSIRIREVVQGLADSGVNDLLLSVDAFHQETIPIDIVKYFAAQAQECGIPIRLSPAWLVSATDDNPYNQITREILSYLGDLCIPVCEGNIVFGKGNALKFLSEYFVNELPENPYVEDPLNVRCISIEPNGNVLNGNIYRSDIMEIIKHYAP